MSFIFVTKITKKKAWKKSLNTLLEWDLSEWDLITILPKGELLNLANYEILRVIKIFFLIKNLWRTVIITTIAI